MRNLKIFLLLIILLPALTANAKDKGPEKVKDHHKILAIARLEGEVKELEKEQNRDRAELDSLHATVGNLDKTDIHQMQEQVEKHGTYFELLTAFTGITAAAIVAEIIHRIATRSKSA